MGVSALILAISPAALAATYSVGPGKQYSNLGAVATKLAPGDVVEVYGDATYSGGVKLTKHGTGDKKITIKGVRVNGKRPVFSGGTNTIEVAANHYLVEGLDIKGGSSRCFYHHGHDVTLRDSVVHDCPNNGVQGASTDSGSLTLDYVEIYAAGSGDQKHGIYMDTDQEAYPGSVFRMQHCYLHDGNGGNMVKSRSERNEIYYNWIEEAYYRELELIGGAPNAPREDSDVVGNVLRNTSGHYLVRVGGDGTAYTNGRYRFVNNTFLVSGSKAVFQAFDGLQTLEMHNNVFYKTSGGGVNVFNDTEAEWAAGTKIMAGQKNWIPTGSTNVPLKWTGTITGSTPGFLNLGGFDLAPTSGSALRDKGAAAPASPANYAFPKPLVTPAYLPPPRKLQAPGTAVARPVSGAIDIGALEYAAVVSPLVTSAEDAAEADAPQLDADLDAEVIGEAAEALSEDEVDDESGPESAASACSVGPRDGSGGALLAAGLLAVGLSLGRRRTRKHTR